MNFRNLEWILLEIVPPRDIQKTARAMEQFFAALHAVHGIPNWYDRNFLGIQSYLFSLEIISQNGEIHFLIRTLPRFRDLIEANIYAQYPEAEITQAIDYVDLVPADIPNEDYDLFGSELILMKEDAYPIRTYPDFEKDIAMDEQRIDPMASLLEVMSKLEQGEQVWIQTLIRPVYDDWKKEGEKLRDKLVGRAEKREQSALGKEAVAWKDAVRDNLNQLVSGGSAEARFRAQ